MGIPEIAKLQMKQHAMAYEEWSSTNYARAELGSPKAPKDWLKLSPEERYQAFLNHLKKTKDDK